MSENQSPAPPQPPASARNARLQNWLKFAGGFLGWYLVNTPPWMNASGGYYGSGILSVFVIMLPINILVLIVLAFVRSTRLVALGILTAIALNFIVSLTLGLAWNAMCLIPFFIR